jgi:hypothetical protein
MLKMPFSGYPSPHLPQIHDASAPKDWMFIECGPFTNRKSFEKTYAFFAAFVQWHGIVGRHRWIGGYPDWRLQVWLPPRSEIYRAAIFALRVADVAVISSSLA